MAVKLLPLLASLALAGSAWTLPRVARAQPAPSAPLTVAAAPQTAAPTPRVVLAQDASFFHHAIGLREARFDNYIVSADLLGIGALYGAGLDFQRLCRLDVRLGGGSCAAIHGRAIHLGSKATLADLEAPMFMTFQGALGTELPAGPFEVTVEARFSADWLDADLHRTDQSIQGSVDAWVFEGGLGVGLRYPIAKDLWVGPSYYGGIAGNEHLGYAHGGKLTLTADLPL